MSLKILDESSILISSSVVVFSSSSFFNNLTASDVKLCINSRCLTRALSLFRSLLDTLESLEGDLMPLWILPWCLGLNAELALLYFFLTAFFLTHSFVSLVASCKCSINKLILEIVNCGHGGLLWTLWTLLSRGLCQKNQIYR